MVWAVIPSALWFDACFTFLQSETTTQPCNKINRPAGDLKHTWKLNSSSDFMATVNLSICKSLLFDWTRDAPLLPFRVKSCQSYVDCIEMTFSHCFHLLQCCELLMFTLCCSLWTSSWDTCIVCFYIIVIQDQVCCCPHIWQVTVQWRLGIYSPVSLSRSCK